MRLTPAQRQARYRERHPERIAAYRESDAKKVSDAKYRANHGTHPMNQPGTKAYEMYRSSEKYKVTSTNEHLKRVYGITYQKYLEMLAAQGGVCGACKGDETFSVNERTRKRMLAVDHCHKTGKIRGLLCGKCNRGMGSFKEDPELLRAAADYLERSAA